MNENNEYASKAANTLYCSALLWSIWNWVLHDACWEGIVSNVAEFFEKTIYSFETGVFCCLSKVSQ